MYPQQASSVGAWIECRGFCRQGQGFRMHQASECVDLDPNRFKTGAVLGNDYAYISRAGKDLYHRCCCKARCGIHLATRAWLRARGISWVGSGMLIRRLPTLRVQGTQVKCTYSALFCFRYFRSWTLRATCKFIVSVVYMFHHFFVCARFHARILQLVRQSVRRHRQSLTS